MELRETEHRRLLSNMTMSLLVHIWETLNHLCLVFSIDFRDKWKKKSHAILIKVETTQIFGQYWRNFSTSEQLDQIVDKDERMNRFVFLTNESIQIIEMKKQNIDPDFSRLSCYVFIKQIKSVEIIHILEKNKSSYILK